MFVFRKIWPALFSCNIRFEIRPFALLPMHCRDILKSYSEFISCISSQIIACERCLFPIVLYHKTVSLKNNVRFYFINCSSKKKKTASVDPFHATGVFILYPLKTLENLWLSGVFRWYRKRPVA